jgi:hypothetical protein
MGFSVMLEIIAILLFLILLCLLPRAVWQLLGFLILLGIINYYFVTSTPTTVSPGVVIAALFVVVFAFAWLIIGMVWRFYKEGQHRGAPPFCLRVSDQRRQAMIKSTADGYFVEQNGDCWQSVFPMAEASKSQLHATTADAVLYMVTECHVPRAKIVIAPS